MVLYILKSKPYLVYLFDIKESVMCTVVVYLNTCTTYGEHERPNLSKQTNIPQCVIDFLSLRERQASIVLEWYFRFEVSLLSFYACERDGPIRVSGGSDIIT